MGYSPQELHFRVVKRKYLLFDPTMNRLYRLVSSLELVELDFYFFYVSPNEYPILFLAKFGPKIKSIPSFFITFPSPLSGITNRFLPTKRRFNGRDFDCTMKI